MTQALAPDAVTESRRLARLRDLEILDTAPEAVFDQLARLAATACGVPIALVSLVDSQRQWFKARVGLEGTSQTPRESAFCAHAIRHASLLEVNDATADPRFAANPLVLGEPAIRFYAGAPIALDDGLRVGTICVIDQTPRQLTEAQRSILTGLSEVAASLLRERAARLAREADSRTLYEATPALLLSIDAGGRVLDVSDRWLAKLGYAREHVVGRPSTDFLTPGDAWLATVLQTGRCDDVDLRLVRHDARLLDVRLSAVLERDERGAPQRALAVLTDMTERVAALAALRESDRILKLVVENLPARISYWDKDSRLLFANRAFLRGFSASSHPSAGAHVSDIIAAPWLARIQPSIDKGLAGTPAQLEAELARSDGSPVVMDVRFTPEINDGRVDGLIVFALDITQRRQAERELARAQQRFELLVDSVQDYALYMLDPQGRVATWNSGAQRIKGYAADEVIGRHFSLFFVPDDAQAGLPERELAQAARDGRFATEAWRCRRDGTPFWANVVLTAIHDDAGALVGFAKVTRDLTEQRRQQDLLVHVAELAPCAMLLTDPQGRIEMVNVETERMFGFTRPELIGQPLDLLLPDRSHVPQVDLHLGAAREASGRRRNGQAFPIEIGLSDIETAAGTATLAAVFDITARRAAQRGTERALAEKETLLREVYHRVKNNLQVIQSLLGLQRRALPEGLARSAIEDSVQRVRAMALVHEMLYQSGNLAAISLGDYTRDLLKQIAQSYGSRARTVTLSAEVPPLETGLDSAVPFGLLVTELISNCLKHAFPDGRLGAVRVSVERQPHGDLLTVADDGVGLPAGLDPAAVTGTMGLQLANGLARQLGGQLQARSGAGGATFSALLKRL